jgi:hypothetical protein
MVIFLIVQDGQAIAVHQSGLNEQPSANLIRRGRTVRLIVVGYVDAILGARRSLPKGTLERPRREQTEYGEYRHHSGNIGEASCGQIQVSPILNESAY